MYIYILFTCNIQLVLFSECTNCQAGQCSYSTPSDSAVCDTCVTGWSPNAAGVCAQCGAGCATCSSDGATCSACDDGYTTVPADTCLGEFHCAKKPVPTMLTYPWKCTVLHCNHLGNTWKPLVLMT